MKSPPAPVRGGLANGTFSRHTSTGRLPTAESGHILRGFGLFVGGVAPRISKTSILYQNAPWHCGIETSRFIVLLVWCSNDPEGLKERKTGYKTLHKRALSEINGILKIIFGRIMLPDRAHDDVMRSPEDE